MLVGTCTQDVVYLSTTNTLSFILLLLCLPAVPHTLLGFPIFPWFFLATEIALGLLIFIAFPHIFENNADGCRDFLTALPERFSSEVLRQGCTSDSFMIPVAVLFLLLFTVVIAGILLVDWLAGKVGIRARRDSPLSAFGKAFAISLFTLFKAVDAELILELYSLFWDFPLFNVLNKGGVPFPFW